MCGIFGLTINQSSKSQINLKRLTKELFILSESRGKEASGIALASDRQISVYKQPVSASNLIRNNNYEKLFLEKNLTAIIGHARLVTNGQQGIHTNNQPVVKDGIVGIHNGIITNVDKLWSGHPNLTRNYEVDTEIILSLIRYFLGLTNNLQETTQKTFQLIEGTASIALLFNDLNYLLLATNNGSLYFCDNKDGIVFASERNILEQFVELTDTRNETDIKHLTANNSLLINLADQKIIKFHLRDFNQNTPVKIRKPLPVIDLSDNQDDSAIMSKVTSLSLRDLVVPDKTKIDKLKRCTRCILPETMPFIRFDEKGVCNYCHGYKKIDYQGEDKLKKISDSFRKTNDSYDCLVALSGGRDSCYSLHYLKKNLGLNVVAYSYDWGMLTDLARRNQARMCGKLGIEHILVSADINKKRGYIRKNVLAWLKEPNLGTIPLFMAGDKQYFYYAHKLKQRMKINQTIMSENALEITNFKTGFCNIAPQTNNGLAYFMNKSNKIKLATYYGKEYIKNPSYFNSSLFDTLFAYASYYVLPHNYINLFDYIQWDEKNINSTLINEYDWETANDTKNTWRIGDGTAPFYNYIYYTVAGFTENDTFRSNQIREGQITREEALQLSTRDNEPRFESIKWYCDTIGIDFYKTIETINKIPKLYN